MILKARLPTIKFLLSAVTLASAFVIISYSGGDNYSTEKHLFTIFLASLSAIALFDSVGSISISKIEIKQDHIVISYWPILLNRTRTIESSEIKDVDMARGNKYVKLTTESKLYQIDTRSLHLEGKRDSNLAVLIYDKINHMKKKEASLRAPKRVNKN